MDPILLISQRFATATINRKIKVQTLWSGYGEIALYYLNYPKNTAPSSEAPRSVILKSVTPPQNTLNEPNMHPRGWSGKISHDRKLASYQVEANWYRDWLGLLPNDLHVPHCYLVMQTKHSEQRHQNDNTVQQWQIMMSDLNDAGFPVRKEFLSPLETKVCLSWLAKLHGHFAIENPTPDWPNGLWEKGSYWHLATRQKEWQNMAESPLKTRAQNLDDQLNNCRFKTIVHGDAKVANFCFNHDMTQVAAVDFQYVGGGCGMKDVIYLIGSCLSSEQCQAHYLELKNYYFNELEAALNTRSPHSTIDTQALIAEWRNLFYIAWADFNRFILGWAPEHSKNNLFTAEMTRKALDMLP